jgi:hypothetical protein
MYNNLLKSEFLSEMFTTSKEYDRFRTKISKFIFILEKEDSFIDNRYMDTNEFKVKYVYQSQSWFDILTKESNQRLTFNWKISCFKAHQLMKGIIENFENNNHYIALILLRNLSEITASLFFNYYKSIPLIKNINLTFNKLEYIEIHDKLEILNRQFSYGSTLKEFGEKYPDLIAKSIMTPIQLVNKKKYSNFEIHYNGLSQIAHPSNTSNRIFGIISDYVGNSEINLKQDKVNLIDFETEFYFRNLNEIEKGAQISSGVMLLKSTIYFMITKNIDIFLETLKSIKELKINKFQIN